MRTKTEIDAIMQAIPEPWRKRWCGGESGACACMGCVQIGNRIAMAEEATGQKFIGDPEYISEKMIPVNVYQKHKITKDEWIEWTKRGMK